jgi:predicted DNA-binding protein
MGQISVTISEETEKLLEDLARATGLTKSSLASEIIRRGLYEEASNLNKVAIFRKQQRDGLYNQGD